MSHLMPTLSGDVSRILLFLKAIRYGRPEEILPEFLLTVKNLSFAPGGPSWQAYWITLSAWKRMVGGMVRPRSCGVFRLIPSSNFVGRSMGRSAGLVPLRILSTKTAHRRPMSGTLGP